MAQGATRPWSTYLFSAEKMPESHIPSKSILSIHTPISRDPTGGTASGYTDINLTAGIRPRVPVKAINAADVGPQSNYVR